jgi:hypothetical protein
MEHQQAVLPPLGSRRMQGRPPSLDMSQVFGRPVMPHQMPSPNKWLGRHVRHSPHQQQPMHQSPYQHPPNYQFPHQQHFGTPQSHLHLQPHQSPHQPSYPSPQQHQFGPPQHYYGAPQAQYGAPQHPQYGGALQQIPLETVGSSGSYSSGPGTAPFDEGGEHEDEREDDKTQLEDESYSDEEADMGPTGVQCTDIMCILGAPRAKLDSSVLFGPRALPAPNAFQCRDNSVLPKTDDIVLSPSEVNDAMASVRCSLADDRDTRDRPYVPNENHYDYDDEDDDYAEDEFADGYNYHYPPGYNFPPGYQHQPGYNCPVGTPGTPGAPCPPGHPGYNYLPANYPPGYNYPAAVPDAVLFAEYAHLAVSPMSYHESLFTVESGGSLSDDEYKPKRQEQKMVPKTLPHKKKPANVPFDEPLLSQISFVQELNPKAGAVSESFEIQPFEPPVRKNHYSAHKADSDDILEDRYEGNHDQSDCDELDNDEEEDERENNSGNEEDDSEDESIGLASYTPSLENAIEEKVAQTRAFHNTDEDNFGSIQSSESLEECPSLEQFERRRPKYTMANRALIDAATVDEDFLADPSQSHDLGRDSFRSEWTHGDRQKVAPAAAKSAPSGPALSQFRHNLSPNRSSMDDVELERMQSRANHAVDVVNQPLYRPDEPVRVTAPAKAEPSPLRPLHKYATTNHEAHQGSRLPEPASIIAPVKEATKVSDVDKPEPSHKPALAKHIPITVAPAAYQPRFNVIARPPCMDEMDIKSMQTHPSFDEHPTPDTVDELMGGRYLGECPTMEEPPSLLMPSSDQNTLPSYRTTSPFTISQSSSRKSGHFTAVTQTSTRSSGGSLDEDNFSHAYSGGRRTPVKTTSVTIPSMLGTRHSSSSDGSDDLYIGESCSVDQPFGGIGQLAAPKKVTPTTAASLLKPSHVAPLPRHPAVKTLSGSIPVTPPTLTMPGRIPDDEPVPQISMKGSSSSARRPITKPLPPGLRAMQLTVPGGRGEMGDVKHAMAMRAQYDHGKGQEIEPWELTRRAIIITTVLQMFKNAPNSTKV